MNGEKLIKIGMIFPGQGSQFVGMSKELYDNERIVQERFEEAGNCLDKNFVQLCFASSETELVETVNAQTSIFLVSASIYSLLKEKHGIIPDVVAGHSLGEYSAVYASEGMNFPDALYLLKKRASFMEEITHDKSTGMLAVIGVSESLLREIVSRHDQAGSDDVVVEIVNWNATAQFILSGTLEHLERVKEEVKNHYGKAISLNVAGAFHSRLMKPVQEKFTTYMEKVDFKDLKIPLINNVDAKEVISAQEIKSSFIRQISSPVLWWQSMQYFLDCDLIVEVGPNTKFARLLEREWPHKRIMSINDQKDIDALLQTIDMMKAAKKEKLVAVCETPSQIQNEGSIKE